MIRKIATVVALILCMTACGGKGASQASANTSDTINNQNTTDTTSMDNNVKVKFETTMGDFTVMLYGDTPKHRDNFVKLVNEHYYDGLLFHRVIQDFMVQTGDPGSRDAKPGQRLGAGDPSYTIEAEILYPKHFNKRGALAAARTGDEVNPERRSSGSQFYIVTGRKFGENQLMQMQMQQVFQGLVEQHRQQIIEMQRQGDQEGLQMLQEQLVAQTQQLVAEGKGGMTPEALKAYAEVGGAPHLDGAYTVFGEVVDGMDTIDKIERVETDRSDRPVDDVRIIKASVVE